jgi:hypothetical protein
MSERLTAKQLSRLFDNQKKTMLEFMDDIQQLLNEQIHKIACQAIEEKIRLHSPLDLMKTSVTILLPLSKDIQERNDIAFVEGFEGLLKNVNIDVGLDIADTINFESMESECKDVLWSYMDVMLEFAQDYKKHV